MVRLPSKRKGGAGGKGGDPRNLIWRTDLIYDNNTKNFIRLERKDYVKYLGVLIDSNLIWKYHISHVASKISKSVGIIYKLRHFVPFSTLLNIYNSLISPYLTYGLVAWGQAAKSHIEKLLQWYFRKESCD